MGNINPVYLFTSAKGRISRQQWWLGMGVLISIWIASSYLLGTDNHIYPVITILAWIAGIMLHIKRFHDRGKSGWWCLVLHPPLLNIVWAIVERGMMRGTSGFNKYGSDPLLPM